MDQPAVSLIVLVDNFDIQIQMIPRKHLFCAASRLVEYVELEPNNNRFVGSEQFLEILQKIKIRSQSILTSLLLDNFVLFQHSCDSRNMRQT